ncbi:MAG TPA: helix-turn-helix domain-containing protein [Acetobacteraceae bacterium]|nr:helix-turn-helix domain-containing protein [Acetobacteraceae bacterium]
MCSAIGEADLQRLSAVAMPSRADVGQTFINEGDLASSFFNVTEGTARLFTLMPDGRRQITGFAGRGDFLGLAAWETYAFSAEAIEPVRYCRFSRQHIRDLLDDFPAFEKRLLAIASHELAAAQQQMLLLGRKTARERVATFLLARSLDAAPCAAPVRHLRLPMTRGDIADYLGLTIETVSRTLTRLKREHLIGIPNVSEILIQDRRGLEAASGGSA